MEGEERDSGFLLAPSEEALTCSALKVKMCQRNRRKISTLTPNSIPKENMGKTIAG